MSRIERTPTDFEKSVGVISLLSVDQIYTFTDSRGRLSLQKRRKRPYEESALSAFLCFSGCPGTSVPTKRRKCPYEKERFSVFFVLFCRGERWSAVLTSPIDSPSPSLLRRATITPKEEFLPK